MPQPHAQKFDFNGLFTFEMANNHQGSVDHGLLVIRQMADVMRETGVRAAVKLQFRDLDTFIHPSFRDSKDNKHIPRFLSTRLSEDQFKILVEETKKQGLVSMCTPFDEPSVDQIERLGVEVIKIGSCSAKDWPLLERVARAGKPVIFSTGGLTISDVDKLVTFFEHRGVDFAMMHCVGIYPTPQELMNLNRLEAFRERYPKVPVGFSTHEDPNDFETIKVAYAKGARLFERHVGVPTETIKLNAYSSTPEQVKKWALAYNDAVILCGKNSFDETHDEEAKSLRSLMRGVYLKTNIAAGIPINREDIYFAMPLQVGQMTSGEWHEGVSAARDLRTHEPLPLAYHEKKFGKKDYVYPVIHEMRGLLNLAKINPGTDFTLELSHHYGVEKMREVGAALITCINREYCKKLIIQLASQNHPSHYHSKKEETFHILYGELHVNLDGVAKILYPGDTLTVHRGIWHSFTTPTGVIFEEISTTHFNNDSFYADQAINALAREARKTQLTNWGRHQLD